MHRLWSETVGRPLWPETWVSFSSSYPVIWGQKALLNAAVEHLRPRPSTLLIPLFGLGGRLSPDGKQT